jgi:hypothetical protein
MLEKLTDLLHKTSKLRRNFYSSLKFINSKAFKKLWFDYFFFFFFSLQSGQKLKLYLTSLDSLLHKKINNCYEDKM